MAKPTNPATGNPPAPQPAPSLLELSVQLPEQASKDDRASAEFIFATLKDVVEPLSLKCSIECKFNEPSKIERWSLDAVAKTYAAVKAAHSITHEQQTELVMFLWNERATIPGQHTSTETLGLIERPEVIKHAMQLLDQFVMENCGVIQKTK